MPGGASVLVASSLALAAYLVAVALGKQAPSAPPTPAGLPSAPPPPSPPPAPSGTPPPVPPPSTTPPASAPPPTVVGVYNQLQPADCSWWQITLYSDNSYGIKLIPPDQYAQYGITYDTMLAYMQQAGWSQSDIDRCLSADFPAAPPVQPSAEWRGLWPWAVVVNEQAKTVTLQLQFEHRGSGGAFVLGAAIYGGLYGAPYGQQLAQAKGWYRINDDADWVLYGPFDLGTVTLDVFLFGCQPFNLYAEIFDGYNNRYLAQQWVFNAFALCGGGVVGG